MNNNTETTSNSMKFTPMPMSALLELMPIQKPASPDSSYTSIEDSDQSAEEAVSTKNNANIKSIYSSTPKPEQKIPPNLRSIVSERKPTRDDNKENTNDQSLSNWTHPHKYTGPTSASKSVLAKKPLPNFSRPTSILPQRNFHIKNREESISKSLEQPHKKTPEQSRLPGSTQKSKVSTPIIKQGIRRFTPSAGKKSNKKTPLKNHLQNNRESVRCLFPEKQNHHRIETPSYQQPSSDYHKPVSDYQQPVPDTPVHKNPPQAHHVSAPETPMNRIAPPAPCAATPSYPQGVVRNQSKILFKTTVIKGKNYMYIKKLGIGGSSEVYKVLEVGTSTELAVKCVNLGTDPELARGYVNEVRLLRELQNSDRVIRLYDYEYDRENKLLRLVLEVGETDLSSFLKARGSGLPPALVLHYWEEMLHAVRHIHEHDVIHADLKPANFLLVCGRLKLIDFGIASSVSSDATSVVRSQATGTYSYISPEALMGGAGGYDAPNAPIKISFRSDVWSLGCILYSMVYGRTPFGHIPNLAKLAAILDPNHKIDYPPVEHLPSSLIAALKWCLKYNVRSRPFVKDLLSIPYLQPSTTPLPSPLMEKLQEVVTQEEYRLLQRARLS